MGGGGCPGMNWKLGGGGDWYDAYLCCAAGATYRLSPSTAAHPLNPFSQ